MKKSDEFKMLSLIVAIQMEAETHNVLLQEKNLLKQLERGGNNLDNGTLTARKSVKESVKNKEKRHAFWYGIKQSLIKDLFEYDN